MLDVALPLLVDAASVAAVCMCLATICPAGRCRGLPTCRLCSATQGSLLFLYGLPCGPTGWRCAWLVVFSSAVVKRALLLPGSRLLPGLVLRVICLCVFRWALADSAASRFLTELHVCTSLGAR